MERWSLVNPGLLADRWFCFAGWFFQLRPGVPGMCWQSERTPACSSFALPSKSVKQVKHSTINGQTSSARNCKYEIESGLSKCGSFSEHETIWPISINRTSSPRSLITHTLLSLTSSLEPLATTYTEHAFSQS